MPYKNDWDELARREPYFAVVTDRRYLNENFDDEARRAFFESGEADVERLLSFFGPEFKPSSALDFGCGVGRLTRALSRRAERVTGCDISPEMIAIAQKNVPAARFVTSLDSLQGTQFDFICSLIVFQHMPVADGLRTLSQLMNLLAPGGGAVLHFSLSRPGSPFKRVLRRLRGASPLVHRIAQWINGEGLKLPYMQMNEYPLEEIRKRIGAHEVVRHKDGEIDGALFVIRASGPDAATPAIRAEIPSSRRN